MYKYLVHGIVLESELELPELRATAEGVPQATVREGKVPVELESATRRGILFEANARQGLLKLEAEAGARFLVQDGKEIIVERVAEAHDSTIRLFLMGSCFATMLFQRSLLPLHASTICGPEGAVLFAGPSGCGKSTLTAAFHHRGYDVLADDVSAISFDAEHVPQVEAGVERIKLWENTLAYFAIDPDTLQRVRPELHKYDLPVGMGIADRPVPIHTIYLLKVHNAPTITISHMGGMRKLNQLRKALYRAEYQRFNSEQASSFTQLSHMARQVRVHVVHYPHDLSRLDELVHTIEQDFAA